MCKFLEINENPILHGYSHSASMFSIISPKVCFGGNDSIIDNLNFDIDGKQINTFTVAENENSECITSVFADSIDGRLKVNTSYSADGRSKGDAYLYNCSSLPMQCSVENICFKWNNMWSFSGIKISRDTNAYGAEFRIGFLANGKIGMMHIYDDHSMDDYRCFNNDKQYKYVKAEIKNNRIISSFSKNGLEWDVFSEEENYINSECKRIGYYLWCDEDRFENWFYSNYILLHSSENLEPEYDVKLDYYNGTHFFDRYDSFNPFLFQQYIDDFILEGSSLIEFVKKAIDHDYYVNLRLNERYIENRRAFKHDYDFDHENMVYGYDDEAIYLAGFDRNQMFVLYTLSYENFVTAYEKNTGKYEINLSKFRVDSYVFNLEPECIKKQLKEYLYGYDPSYREDLMISDTHRVYGIKIYDILLKNLKKLNDRRIVYILKEHHEIMIKRIEYFYKRNIINYNDYEGLHSEAVQLCRNLDKLVFSSLKYNITKDDKISLQMKPVIEKIKKDDIEFINHLINSITVLED